VENLAEHVAQIILGEFHAPWVRVSIAKIGALRNARRVGVVIERNRQE
jgi:dihydroneopterin aldolase